MSMLPRAAVKADRNESHFRLRAAFLAMFFVFLNFVGVAWDIQWHSDVGPDSFWTMPHIFWALPGAHGLRDHRPRVAHLPDQRPL